MMNLLLSSVSASAILAGTPAAGIIESWVLDATKVTAGYTLSNLDLTLTNTSGGTDFRNWVPTVKPLELGKIYYWEVALLTDTGAATYNGYMGVVTQDQIDLAGSSYDDGANPIDQGSLAYRGNGDLWGNTGTSLASGLPTYGVGDVLMFGFNPDTGDFWTGKNGVWDRTPGVDAARVQSTVAGGVFYPVVQGRNTGDGGTLRTTTSEYSYPIPDGLVAPGVRPPIPISSLFGSRIHVLHGKSNKGGTVSFADTKIVHGTPPVGGVVSQYKTFVIVEG